jgi:PAS domain S-box-containing protein
LAKQDGDPMSEASPRVGLATSLRRTVPRYLLVLVIVTVAFGVRKVLEPLTGTGAPFVLFFGCVVATSVWAGPGPGILTTLLSMPIGAFVFVVRAGFTTGQALTQSALFAVDALVVVYLSMLMTRARRRAERSEAQQRDIVDLAPDAFFLADLEGRFKDVNQGACRLLGYSREELLGKTIADLIPPEDLPRLAKVRASLLEPGRVEKSEWRQRRKDGSLVPVEVSSNILPDGRWQAFVRDISDRKRVEDERQIHVSLLDASSDFIGIADPTGKPIYLNPAGRRMVGLSADHVVETTQISDYYPVEERAFVTDVILRSTVERGRWSGETALRHWQTGAAIPVSDEHFMIFAPGGRRVIGMATITRDISAARQAAREREELLAREQEARARAERTNAELRESEERFRLTIDEAPIGMALVALDGRFVRVNAALCEIVGYPRHELERLRFQDITHPEDLDTDLALLDRLHRGEIPRYQLEKRYIHKDGRRVTIQLSTSIMRSPAGAPLCYIAQIEDFSERKRAETALRLSEARFSGIISISADAIVSIDEAQRITLFNDGAEKIFGYPRSEAVGMPLETLMPERFRASHRQHVAGFAAGRTVSRRMGERAGAILGRRKSGEEFPAEASISKLDVDGRTILTVALRDITERKRSEDEQRFLAEAGAALATSLDFEQTLSTLSHLIVRELADWCVLDLLADPTSPMRIKVVSGRPDSGGLCARLEQLHLDRRLPHLALPLWETRRPYLVESVTPARLASFAQSDEHLHLLRAVDPRSIIGVPLLTRGQVIGAMILISSTPSRLYRSGDLRFAEAIAERGALAIENGRLYQTSVRATQLRDEVLGVVAHDLRNPVAAITMLAASMKRRGGEPERRNQKSTQGILRAANRANRLIGDLLDVSLIEAGQLKVQREPLSTRQLLTEAAEAQRPLVAAASIDLRLELPDRLPDILGDQHRLLQVLENLIGNALKFTPVEGRITIGATSHHGEMLLWVADTGCGISSEGLPHVFDRFWQAGRGARQGAGLGLPITRGIVEAHGGRIWVESTLGRGTTIFFTIPEATRPAAQYSESLH